jgi:hypothetical protein
MQSTTQLIIDDDNVVYVADLSTSRSITNEYDSGFSAVICKIISLTEDTVFYKYCFHLFIAGFESTLGTCIV